MHKLEEMTWSGLYNTAYSQAANHRPFQRAWGPRIRTSPWIPLTQWGKYCKQALLWGGRGWFKIWTKCKITKFPHSKHWKSSWLMANQTVNSLLQPVNLFYLNGCWQKTLFCVTFIVISFPANWFCRLSAVYQARLLGEETPHKGRKVHKWITNFKCYYLCSLPTAVPKRVS